MKKEQKANEKKESEQITELEKLRKDYDSIKELLQRTAAEFQNYVKRNDEEKKQFLALANEDLIEKMLPVLDHFELALKNKGKDFETGIELIHSELKELLLNEGLTPIVAEGKFDPAKHEAIFAEQSEKEPNTILEEFQKGYSLGSKVIRHSKVKISKR